MEAKYTWHISHIKSLKGLLGMLATSNLQSRLPNYEYVIVLAFAGTSQAPPSSISFVPSKFVQGFTWFTLAQL